MNSRRYLDDIDVSPAAVAIPEPGTAGLLLDGLAAVWGRRRVSASW